MNKKPNKHSTILDDYLYQLYNDQALCDLSFITRTGTTVLAHKLVVAAFSGTVRTEVKKGKDIVQIHIKVDCEDVVLRKILEFIYTGKVDCKKELLPLLQQTSSALQIPSLQNYLKEEFQYSEETSKRQSGAHKSMLKSETPLSKRTLRKQSVTHNSSHSSETSLTNGTSEKQSFTYNALHTSEAFIFSIGNSNSPSSTDNLSERSEEGNKTNKISLRDRKDVKSYKQQEFDFEWSDGELCDFSDIDDDYVDETWSIELENKPKKGSLSKDSEPKTKLKRAVVKLERIDKAILGKIRKQLSASRLQNSKIELQEKTEKTKTNLFEKPVFRNVSSSVKRNVTKTQDYKRFSRKNLTQLAEIRKKKNLFKKKQPKLKLSKHCLNKVKGSIENYLKNKSSVLKGKQIFENYKKQVGDVEFTRYGYSCRYCNFRNKYSSVVRLHAKRHRGRTDSERFAGKKFATNKFQKALEKKKLNRIKRKISRLECFLCEKNYKEMRNLATHLIKHHEYTAEKTQKLTGYPRYFVINTHTKPVCKECNEEFNHLFDLRIHCRSVHKKRRIDPDIPCTQEGCMEKFLNLKSLKAHLSKHHKIKNAEYLSFRQQTPKLLQDNFNLQDVLPSRRARKKEKLIELEKNDHFSNGNMKGKMCNGSVQENALNENVHCRRIKRKYKIILPSKVFKCNRCAKSFKSRHKMIHRSHKDVAHKKIFVSKQFTSQLLIKQCLFPKHPTLKDVTKNAVDADQSVSQRTAEKTENQKLSQARQSSKKKQKVGSKNDKSSCNGNTKNEDQNGELDVKRENITEFSPDLYQSRRKYQYGCSKCDLSFSHYSSFCLHLKKKHKKYQIRQEQIFRKIVRHVQTRKELFTMTFRSSKKRDPKNRKKFVCDICAKVYRHMRSLARHLRVIHRYKMEEARQAVASSLSNNSHQIRKKIKCIDCESTFLEVRSLAKHLQRLHKYTFAQAKEATGYPSYSYCRRIGSKPTKCKICSLRLPTVRSYKRHRVEVHGVKCEYCHKKFGNRFILKRHGLREHPEYLEEFSNIKVKTKTSSKHQSQEIETPENEPPKIYDCEKCDFSTERLKLMTSHVLDNHPEVEHPCPVCGFTFRQKVSLETHIRKHHGEAEKKKIPCAWCKKRFLKSCTLRIHQFKVHGIPHPSIKQYSCDFEGCCKVLYTLSDLNEHKKKHLEQKTYPCSECDYEGRNKHGLLKHIRIVHLQMQTNLCESCGKFFSEQQHLKEHIRKYHTDNYYVLQCEFCAYRCGLKNQLMTHMWQAHKVRMPEDNRQYYKCDTCAYQTPLLHKFKNHVNSHTGTRNYGCDECDRKFVTSSTLRCHKMWKHPKDEEKICNQCGYKTKTTTKLNEHIRVQHQLKGIKPYRCPYCDFRCATSGNCRKHVMGKHKGQPVKYEVDKEYLDIAKIARLEGNTNPLLVQIQTPVSEEFTDQQILASQFDAMPPYDPGIFNQIIQESIL